MPEAGGSLYVGAAAAMVFVAWAAYYGFYLFPGLGGELNAGDSAKFQILGHTSILVHGPGYPLVLLLGSAVRALDLPLPPWWMLTFALSAVPAALANVFAFLIVRRLTRSVLFGAAATLLLGSAGLMAVQATEAEVYALTLAFILATLYLLVLFVETRRLPYFLAACAVYALSFGNHLMMIMLLPVFLGLTVVHHRMILRFRPAAAILLFILLGASQYLYLAYIAYSPETAYSEYMPLPPTPVALVNYVLGTYFGDLYGSGLSTTATFEALMGTLQAAHPWISMPLIIAGMALFVAGWRGRDSNWRGLSILFGAAFCFVPFMLWYGAPDIRAFHLPVLGPLLVAAAATLGWSLRGRPAVLGAVAALILAFGIVRATQVASFLGQREPLFAGFRPAIGAMIAQSRMEAPIFAMSYKLSMVALYHQLRGALPRTPAFQVRSQAVHEIEEDQPFVGGIVVPTDGYQFVSWIKHRRPDMSCSTEKIDRSKVAQWPAYAFMCRVDSAHAPIRTGSFFWAGRDATSAGPLGR